MADTEIINVVTDRADKHVWPVTVFNQPFTTCEECDALKAIALVSDGFMYKGLAIAYIKRMAKNSPDGSSVFFVFRWKCENGTLSKWVVYISDGGAR